MKYEYRIGDRVEYTGNSSLSFIGKKGTVVKDVSTDGGTVAVTVRFDGKSDSETLYCMSFTKINNVEQEIEKALAVLKKYGKVEFKKNRPAFNPVEVRLNADHTAVVHEGYLKVGCQFIQFDVIDKLAFEIGHAREYTAAGERE